MEKINDTIHKNRWLILLIVVMEPFMACLDSSIVNVALPDMSLKLNVPAASIQWVITSYLIVIISTIMLFGRLGDIYGKTTVFNYGLVFFTLGSLLCGMSNSLVMLIAARVIQGIGASATMATNQGIITQVFPANERGRALGISGTFVALGAMIGPPLGGFIISVLSWQYIFLINVPIGIAAFLFGLKILPKTSKKIKEKLDLTGSLLFALFVVLLFGCLVQGQETGFVNKFIIMGFVFSFIFLILFIMFERKTDSPMLELSIFKNKLFSISIICAFILFIAIGASNIMIPFYLQDTLKLSAALTGILMMISPIVLSVVAPLSGYLSDKIGSELLTFIGLLLTSTGLLLISTLTEFSAVWMLILFLGIMSAGNGLFQSPNTSLIMSTVPRNKLGIAGSINALVRNLGIVFGVSMSTTLLYASMSQKIGHHVDNYIVGRDDVFMYGMRAVYIAAAVICLVGAVITAIRLKNRNKNNDIMN